MTTQALDLSAVRAAATVGAVAFVDTVNAVSLIRAAGDSYEQAGAAFFKVSAAACLYLGDTQARQVAKDIWPDSKHKSREYFLKVARAVTAAQQAGRAEQVASVATFAALQALGKAAPAANDDTTETGSAAQPLESIAAQAAKLAEDGKRASGEISRLNAVTRSLEAIEAQAFKLADKVPMIDAGDNATIDKLLAGDSATLKNTTKSDLIRMLADLCNVLADSGSQMRDSADVLAASVAGIRAAMQGDAADTGNEQAANLQAA